MLSFKSLISTFLLLQTAAAAGYVNAAYYASWTAWSGYTVDKLNSASLSHAIYAFAKISENGTVLPGEIGVDEQLMYPGDVKQSGENVYGNIKQLYLLKKKNRKLKTLLSIGGFTASQNGDFINASKTTNHRNRFIASSVQLMLDWGMDGLDLDWEYPEDSTQASNYVKLLQGLRQALDAKSSALGQKYHYLLTAAVPAGPTNYNKMSLSKMNPYLDFFNLMAYDYSGLWSPVTAHQANLYHDSTNPSSTPFSTEKAVKDYIAKGVSSKKINLGIPLYGRSFPKTAGLGKTFDKSDANNDQGIIPYNQLPKAGATLSGRSTPGAMTTWDGKTKEVVSLDGEWSCKLKVNFLKKYALGGAFFWEASGDKTGSSSLVTVTKKALGGLDDTNNQLAYPSSRYVNMRNGMPSTF
ncbi:glycosyl hydrolases family 18 domain-containing protein [Sarocladium implicatum]|nr:glycosyl hydrolases family 18 domain-containing protein [Sarocladium implicatum]